VKILRGKVSSRFGAATPNLRTVESVLLERTGLPSMAPGTLNVQLNERYVVAADALIDRHEYFTGEVLKFQRCRVRGHRMFIMRPDSHEQHPAGPRDPARVIELVSRLKLRDAWGLKDGNVLEVEVEGNDEWWDASEPSDPGL
jgi:DNA polymerase alpha-binding protein Ctf4